MHADMIASVKTKTSVSIHTHLSESTIKNFINQTEDFEFSDLDDDNLFDIKPANQNESKIIEFRNETRADEPK